MGRQQSGAVVKTENRIELIVVAVFFLSNLLIPMFYDELFPFSRFELYSDSPKLYTEYFVRDPKGHILNNYTFGVYRYHEGIPLQKSIGVIRPYSINHFGKIASESTVKEQIRKVLKIFPYLPYVVVTQDVIGPQNEMTVGVIQSRKWTIYNPVHQLP